MKNLHHALGFHPAVREKVANAQRVRTVIGYDDLNRETAFASLADLPSPFVPDMLPLEHVDAGILTDRIDGSDIFILLYASSTLPCPKPEGPAFLDPIRSAIVRHWKKSVLFKDYGIHLEEAFSEPLHEIAARNARLIDVANASSEVRFEDGLANCLVGTLSGNQRWTSVDGMGNLDLVPGEIATHIGDLSGTAVFDGTFLSTIPFASKYGVVDERFLTLQIDQSRVTGFECADLGFCRDFDAYLNAHPNNRHVQEFGIGTNLGVKGLYGRNAGFEERHPGLHLGLGGGQLGSHHLDLIFRTGLIKFGDKVVFDSVFFLE
ncbi:leucyl aminopeptidase [Paraburkholderia rhizosphaerae]|nr:leucyl aminopeptidase [Paraburkholderia rhizosphaerae]